MLATGYGTQSAIAGSLAVIDKPYDRKHLQAAFVRIFSLAGGAAAQGLPPLAD